jgi:hypothetical protein
MYTKPLRSGRNESGALPGVQRLVANRSSVFSHGARSSLPLGVSISRPVPLQPVDLTFLTFEFPAQAAEKSALIGFFEKQIYFSMHSIKASKNSLAFSSKSDIPLATQTGTAWRATHRAVPLATMKTQRAAALVIRTIFLAVLVFFSAPAVFGQALTNGLVAYWPLDVLQGDKTPDVVSGYDMQARNLVATNVVPGVRSNWSDFIQRHFAKSTAQKWSGSSPNNTKTL